MRAAAACSLVAGLGFGLPAIGAIDHLVRTGEVWVFLGFPTYGDGPFERVGIETTVPLLAAFLAVCAAEVALAVALWRRVPSATRWSLALLPVELAFWVGFALPFGPVLGAGRVVLGSRRGRRGPAHRAAERGVPPRARVG